MPLHRKVQLVKVKEFYETPMRDRLVEAWLLKIPTFLLALSYNNLCLLEMYAGIALRTESHYSQVGGCTWSQLKSCSSGKEFVATHRAKLNSVSQNISLNKFKRNSVAVTTGANSNTLEVISDFVKGVDNSKIMGIKLYSVSDSPPTLAVRMSLKYLGLEYEIVNIDYANGEQVSEAFRQKNPQGEVPLLEDNGLLLSESVAIIQYLADKYKKDETFYPSAPEKRAIVNHRLAFHLSTYYKAVVDYMILPLCYAYPRTEENLKKLVHALKVFEEYFQRSNSTYAAGDQVTIADLPLIMGTVCLESMGLDLSPFPRVKAWYEGFKKNNADLWSVGVQGLEELTAFEKNPPDLSHVKHPIHPTDKTKLK